MAIPLSEPATLAVRWRCGLARLRLSFSDGRRVCCQRVGFARGVAEAGARGAALTGKRGLSASAWTLLRICCRRSAVRHRELSSRRRAQPPRCPLLVRSGGRISGDRRHRRPASGTGSRVAGRTHRSRCGLGSGQLFSSSTATSIARCANSTSSSRTTLHWSNPALHACWRARPDPDALLRDAVPARTDSLISFLTIY